MRYPIKDKFWGWRMDPFEVFAYWDSKENQPQLTLTLKPLHAGDAYVSRDTTTAQKTACRPAAVSPWCRSTRLPCPLV